MKRFIEVLILGAFLSSAGYCSWWSDVGGQLPNLSGNYIYAGNFKTSYADLESTIFIWKINGNPLNLNIGYVPQTEIGVFGVSYDLNNLPVTVDYAWRGIMDVTVSVGMAYDTEMKKYSWTIGGKLIQIKF